jgi:hypothetical protein
MVTGQAGVVYPIGGAGSAITGIRAGKLGVFYANAAIPAHVMILANGLFHLPVVAGVAAAMAHDGRVFGRTRGSSIHRQASKERLSCRDNLRSRSSRASMYVVKQESNVRRNWIRYTQEYGMVVPPPRHRLPESKEGEGGWTTSSLPITPQQVVWRNLGLLTVVAVLASAATATLICAKDGTRPNLRSSLVEADAASLYI